MDRADEKVTHLIEFANHQQLDPVASPQSEIDLMKERQKQAEARQTKALAMHLAGIPLREIAEQLGIHSRQVTNLIDEVEPAPRTLKKLRAVENARLDAAQAAIWPRVMIGDDDAIKTFLMISRQRAKLNGLNEATKLDISMGVRTEMETALSNLQELVLGEVISSDDGR